MPEYPVISRKEKWEKFQKIHDTFHISFRNSIPRRIAVCRIVISNDLVSRAESGSGPKAKGGPWPNSIYRALESRRCLDFRAPAASTGRLPLAWKESPGGVWGGRLLEDAESRRS